MSGSCDIHHSVNLLRTYIEAEDYKGFDPYDGLQSPFFQKQVLKSKKKLRFYAQQLLKRLPVNLRPLAGIAKGLNPVTLGLCLQGYAELYETTNNQEYITQVLKLSRQLKEFIPAGYRGTCWGYDFDWESRYVSIPAFQPTVVATGFITNALFRAAKKCNLPELNQAVISACEFVLHDLNRTYAEDDSFCFSYSPFDKEQVFNASMKGVRILSQGYSLTGNENYRQQAKQAVTWVMNHQRDDGAWIYSGSKAGSWIDNYHTAYILDCLDDYQRYTGDYSFDTHLKKGLKFYITNFFEPNGLPKFYNVEAYPTDCTAAAQSIITLLRFGEKEAAMKTACCTIQQMQSGKGYFYFRKFKYYTIKTSFMRWSNAWMFAALTALLKEENNS